MDRLRALLVVALCILAHIALSQSNHFIHYSTHEGLPSSEVYHVYQDKKGFMWFATDNGVVRFDGKNMELFQTNDGLSDPVVFEFIEDSKGRLWFRTYSGNISYFFNERIYSYAYNDSLSSFCKNSLLESLYIDTDDQLWFGSSQLYGKIDSTGRITKAKTKNLAISIKHVDNEIIHSHNGIGLTSASVDGENANIQPYRGVGLPIICTVKWRGAEYFSFGNAIYKTEGKIIKPVFTGAIQIISLSIDNDDNLWVGYMKGGTECYRHFGTKKPNHFDFVNTKSVTRIWQDRQGGYWLSTLEDGVYYVPYDDFLFETIPFNQKITKAIAFHEKIILGNVKGELIILNSDGKTIHKIDLSDEDSHIYSMLAASEKQIWVSGWAGTYIIDKSLNIKQISYNNFTDLHLDKVGKIWGKASVHRIQYDQDGKKLKDIIDNKSNRLMYSNDRYQFLFGRLGLQVFTFKNEEVKLPKFFESLRVTKILSLNSSLLIMGTLGSGFLIVDQDNWSYEQYSSKHRFVANSVYDLLKEGTNIWMGTERGIALASEKSIINRNPDFSFLFAKSKATDNDKINHLVSGQHNVFAFGEDSFFILPKLIRASTRPTFSIQSILVNNQEDSLREERNLDYDQNNIQINFRFIDFKNQNIFIRSRLASNLPWNYSTDRNVKFYSLQSGEYNLELEYSIDNFHWNKAFIWNFTILPPWWRTWYFQVAVIVILAAWAIFYFRRRVVRVNERNSYLNLINAQQQNLIRAELETLERERNRIAKDLHDSVGTNLTAIKMIVRSTLKKYEDPKAESIENEFQNTIQDIKGIIHELVPAGLDKYGLTETVRNYAAKIEGSLNLKIEVNSFGADIKNEKLSLLTFRILQELLSNTLKHAQADKVVIHINSFEDLLSILYQDNGKGFEIDSVKKGSGLMNIQSRIQTANGSLKFESGNFGVSYIIDLPINLNGNDQNSIS